MQIYLAQNGRKAGPYAIEVVQQWLASGRVSSTDLAWDEGLAGWVPLGQIVAQIPGGSTFSPPVPLKRSRVAIASFVIASATVLVLMGSALAFNPYDNGSNQVMMLVWFCMLGGVAANIVGAILGGVALGKPSSNKWMAVAGLILNLLELCVFVLIDTVKLSLRG
jgi:hypothetical protein